MCDLVFVNPYPNNVKFVSITLLRWFKQCKISEYNNILEIKRYFVKSCKFSRVRSKWVKVCALRRRNCTYAVGIHLHKRKSRFL